MHQVSKKDYAIALLKEKKPVQFIQDQLKATFGTGMSNRDLTSLRKRVRATMLFPTFDNYQQGFLELYESTLGLQKILLRLTKNEFSPEVHEWYEDITPTIQKYHAFYHDTRKELLLKDLPPALRTPKVIHAIMESLDELKNGDFISPEDL
jgi:hypothetical protein